jgi:hypothetical protein
MPGLMHLYQNIPAYDGLYIWIGFPPQQTMMHVLREDSGAAAQQFGTTPLAAQAVNAAAQPALRQISTLKLQSPTAGSVVLVAGDPAETFSYPAAITLAETQFVTGEYDFTSAIAALTSGQHQAALICLDMKTNTLQILKTSAVTSIGDLPARDELSEVDFATFDLLNSPAYSPIQIVYLYYGQTGFVALDYIGPEVRTAFPPAGAYLAIKHKWNATAAPGVGDDSGDGYTVGSMWCDTTNDKVYFCADAAVGAAVWLEVGGGAGAPTNAQYLALAANAGLSDERVLTPGAGLAGADSGAGAAYTLSVDINGQTPDATPDGAADYVMTYDASAPGLKKVLLNNLPAASGAYLPLDGSDPMTGVLDMGGHGITGATSLGINGGNSDQIFIRCTLEAGRAGVVLNGFGDTNSAYGILNFYRARGSYGAETNVANGDLIGQIYARAYHSSTYKDMAAIKFTAVTPTTNVPGRISFLTSNGVAFLTRVLIDENGEVTFSYPAIFADGSAPANPPAGSHKLYSASDGLHVLSSAGVDVGPLGAGAAIAAKENGTSIVASAVAFDFKDANVEDAGSSVAAIYLNLPGICDGRLTLESGVPISTTDQTAKTTLYFTPYKGNKISIYDGTRWKLYTFAELSISLAGKTADKNNDVFVYDNSGTLTLELVEWTNDSTRATALALQDGVYCKTGALTRRYLGTIRTTGTTGQCETSRLKWFVWNLYNQALIDLWREETTSYSYTTLTWRQAYASAANQVEFVQGLTRRVDLWTSALVYAASSPAAAAGTAIGLDSTSSIASSDSSGYFNQPSADSQFLTITARLHRAVAAGYHYAALLERGPSGGTCTWYDGVIGGHLWA